MSRTPYTAPQVADSSLISIEQQLAQALEQTFGWREFRKGQLSILRSVVAKRDTLAVMPTGGGKSLCYQLPAILGQGLVVVISPLIALMNDQVRNLRAKGVRAGCLHSGQELGEKREIFSAIRAGGSYLLYLSPERVQNPGFAAWIKEQPVLLFAIDEAHCVSQWGPDFREDYHKLHLLRDLRPDVPILGLTATATPQVLGDVSWQLRLNKPDRHVYGFYRPNLFYQVESCTDEQQKIAMLKKALAQHPQGRILIYCGTRQQTQDLAATLESEFKGVGFYHAGLTTEERQDVQQRLNRGELRILAATNAFGMGIDYPDVRLVVHFQMPAAVESFYQEMGRAGRDGKPSTCLLLYAKKDRGLQSFFITKSKAEPAVVRRRWEALEAMTQFAEGGECRHAGILTYFRDEERISSCGHCDVCAPKSDRLIAKPAPSVVLRKKPKNKALILENAEAEVRALVLRDWRKQYAKERDLPAFMIFSDRTLMDLANQDPKSDSELGRIYGMGPVKCEQLGQAILEKLKECR